VKILALDSATESCSVALFIDGRMITREKRLERGHAGHILAMTDEVLAEAGVALGTLSAIAFGRGPGAFTGVRLAASVTQGLAFGAGLPVVPVSDLRALAQRALGADHDVARVLACTDARMREVYWGCFERREGLAAPLGDEHLSGPDAVTLPAPWSRQVQASTRSAGKPPIGPTAQPGEAALRLAGERVCGAGRGFAAYPQLRAALHSALDSLREELVPGAAEIALLAAPEVAGGQVFPPEQALPVYLRDDIARAPNPQSLN
jgi:tRNA threonylcarbamoyladenosine biosynthesis protein TsaB